MIDKVLDGLRRSPLFTAGIDAARRMLPTPVLIWLRSQMVRNLKGTPSEVFPKSTGATSGVIRKPSRAAARRCNTPKGFGKAFPA